MKAQGTTRTIGHPLGKLTASGIVVLIRSYQILIAPLLVGGGCRHQPTCSEYAIEAFRRHGVRKGLKLSAARIWRCRPGGSYGYDPVPFPGQDVQPPAAHTWRTR